MNIIFENRMGNTIRSKPNNTIFITIVRLFITTSRTGSVINCNETYLWFWRYFIYSFRATYTWYLTWYIWLSLITNQFYIPLTYVTEYMHAIRLSWTCNHSSSNDSSAHNSPHWHTPSLFGATTHTPFFLGKFWKSVTSEWYPTIQMLTYWTI